MRVAGVLTTRRLAGLERQSLLRGRIRLAVRARIT
jgi:hypothetical protein